MPLQNLYPEKTQQGAQEFQRYIVAGLINTVASFLVYAFFVKLTPFPYWAANFCATITGIICGYILAKHYVFPLSEKNTSQNLPRYIIIVGLQFVVSTSLITLLRKFGLSDILGYIASLPIIVILSFGLQKSWAFKPLIRNS